MEMHENMYGIRGGLIYISVAFVCSVPKEVCLLYYTIAVI